MPDKFSPIIVQLYCVCLLVNWFAVRRQLCHICHYLAEVMSLKQSFGWTKLLNNVQIVQCLTVSFIQTTASDSLLQPNNERCVKKSCFVTARRRREEFATAVQNCQFRWARRLVPVWWFDSTQPSTARGWRERNLRTLALSTTPSLKAPVSRLITLSNITLVAEIHAG